MNRSKILVSCGIAALLAVSPVQLAAAPDSSGPSYKTTTVIPLGAPDRWDYLQFDPQTNRVYVSHGDRVTVVDGRTGTIVGNVMGMPGGTHGIAISHATGEGFTDDGKAGEAVTFDLETLQVKKRVKAEADADGLIYDGASNHVFVIDGDSGKFTVIDPKTDNVIATIDGGGGLEFGVSGGDGKLYANGEEKHEILRVDTATNRIDAHWPMPDCERPHGFAIDTVHRRLFSTCVNEKMIVMNADNGAIVAELPIGKGTDSAGFDPVRQLAFSSNYSGTLSVIHEVTPDKYEALPAIDTPIGARTMTIDPKTGRIYLVAADVTVNPNVPATDLHHHYNVTPGTAKLYFLDPTK